MYHTGFHVHALMCTHAHQSYDPRKKEWIVSREDIFLKMTYLQEISLAMTLPLLEPGDHWHLTLSTIFIKYPITNILAILYCIFFSKKCGIPLNGIWRMCIVNLSSNLRNISQGWMCNLSTWEVGAKATGGREVTLKYIGRQREGGKWGRGYGERKGEKGKIIWLKQEPVIWAAVVQAFNPSTLKAETVDLCEFKTSSIYRASSITARATRRNYALKNQSN